MSEVYHSDIGEVRQRLLVHRLTLSDAEREYEISRLGAQIEFLGACEESRRLCERLIQLVAQRPPEFIESLERELGLSGARD